MVSKMNIAEKRIHRYRIFLYIFLGFAIGMFCWAAYSYYKQSIPDTIRIKTGSCEEINFGIPALGTILTDSTKVITLNQPVTLVAGETEESYEMELKLFGVLPLKNIDIQVIKDTMLTPIGEPIGIYVKTQGVLVIDTGEFKGMSGEKLSPSMYKLQAGDYLTAMDGVAITGKKQIKEYVEQSEGKDIIFQISRKEEIIQVKIKPELDEQGNYKMGAWLRDSAQGIGTMTYMDQNHRFGALGHGINDMDTGELLKLGNGLLYETQIVAIQKGERGKPGELTGVIEYQPDKVTGVITRNTGEGIYGVATEDFLKKEVKELPVALKHEITTGPAQIWCNVSGNADYYDIELTRLSYQEENKNRQISFRVTDERLLQLTGGIVQGMSGACIIKDGKIIGAVTHVLVDDPKKGYGIFIEDMLAQQK